MLTTNHQVTTANNPDMEDIIYIPAVVKNGMIVCTIDMKKIEEIKIRRRIRKLLN